MFNNPSILELLFIFNIKKLQDELRMVEEKNWLLHPNKSTYKGSWLVTSLTSTNADTKNIIAVKNQDYYETLLLKDKPYIKEIIKTFETKVEAVRFMKLDSNSIIKEHCDKGSSFEEGYARIHIPIEYKMKLGKCYYIDANNPHSVINDGDSSRVHLLIDCHINSWFEKFFLNKGFKKSEYKYMNKTITDDNVNEVIDSLTNIGTQTAITLVNKLEKIKNQNNFSKKY